MRASVTIARRAVATAVTLAATFTLTAPVALAQTARDKEEKKQSEPSRDTSNNNNNNNNRDVYVINDGGWGGTYPSRYPSAPPSASFYRNLPRILFTSDRNGATDIYIMVENGNNVRRVTQRNGASVGAVFGPVKGRVAYIAAQDRIAKQGGAIALMNADGRKPKTIYMGLGRNENPAWSPDEKLIAFSAEENGNTDIFVVDSGGNNRRKITSNSARDTEPVFSPDGYRIAFISDRDGKPAVYTMNSDGTGAAQRISPADGTVGDCSKPAYSPNGRFIVFSAGDDTKRNLYIAYSDGTNVRRLMDHPSINTDPVFNPESTRIAFTSNRTGNFAIYTMDVDGTNIQQVTFGAANDTRPSWGW
jgi:TolB protein